MHSELLHAEGHLKAMDNIHSTAENLQAAIDGETYEFTAMYPPMIEQAEAEDHKARRMFKYASQAEAVHAKIYKLALELGVSGGGDDSALGIGGQERSGRNGGNG